MLGIAYSASIGGIATLIGTPPNLVLAGILETQFTEVQAAVEGQGMQLKKTTRQGEWRSGVFVHAA